MTRAGLSEDEREARETLLAAIKWRLDHYGPRDAEPFQFSRFESEAHAALDAVIEAGWVPAARTADLAAQVARVKALAEAGIWPDRANLATSVVMRDVRDALTAALSPAQPDTEGGAS